MASKWRDEALLRWHLLRGKFEFLLQMLKLLELGVWDLDAQLVQLVLQLEGSLLNRDDAALFED